MMITNTMAANVSALVAILRTFWADLGYACNDAHMRSEPVKEPESASESFFIGHLGQEGLRLL